jgi:hypothetical protein
MRSRAALGVIVLLACAGCGGAHHHPLAADKKKVATRAAGLATGVVGPLRVDVPGIAPRYGTLAQVATLPLVLVSARAASLQAVAAAADAEPRTHFAYVGGSTKDDRRPNLVGLVLRDDEAARLAGIVAALTADAQGGATPRVAWVGPEEERLARPFAAGVHDADPAVTVLHQWSQAIPALCKEAALTAIERGAAVVMAHGGLCADAAEEAAHEQDVPALRIANFELPSVAAGLLARDAAAGLFRGREDIVFGASSGAIAIGTLDPRVGLATVVRARSIAAAG